MLEIFIALSLGLIGGLLSIWWVNRAHERRRERLHRDMRANAGTERDRQIQAAKDRGDFDIWQPDD